MKKLPIIIGIPAIAVAIVVGGALLWRTKTQIVKPTPTPASAADLNNELQATTDDGGASDFTSIKSEASGL